MVYHSVESMKTKQYLQQTVLTLMSAPSVNFISKFLGAEVVRGRLLKEGSAYCRGKELNHVKNWSWSF